jgi:sulfatase modifying factor 1
MTAWLRDLEPGQGNATELHRLADRLAAEGDVATAATAYDRAYGLTPYDDDLAAARSALLERLTVVEHGMRFRYVPAGCYAMGSPGGDPDEQPVHVVRLAAFWLSETPVTWPAYCALLGWSPPPAGFPEVPREQEGFDRRRFMLAEANKIRRGYSGDDQKPMVAVAWQEAEVLADHLSTPAVRYRLPTEAEWEAAARGGLVGARYAWGDTPPTSSTCDFNRFDEFSLLPTRSLPPNGYGLYGMSGGVWEWTADYYDAWYYHESPRDNPSGPAEGLGRVLRGGSWADCAEVVTVTFRTTREATPWWEGEWGMRRAPNIGFRLCRVASHPFG